MRPGAHYFPDARLNFAENLLRRSGSADAIVFGNERRTQRTWSFDQLRAEVAGFAGALARPRRAAGRSDRRLSAEPARNHRGRVRSGKHRRGLVLVLAGLWRHRASSTGSARSRRACSSPPTVISMAARPSTGLARRDGLEGLPTIERTVVVPYTGSLVARPASQRRHLGRLRRTPSASAARVRAAAVQPSALHHLFVGHHRRAQMHRPRRRRHADSASEGAPAPLRHQARTTASSTSRRAAG